MREWLDENAVAIVFGIPGWIAIAVLLIQFWHRPKTEVMLREWTAVAEGSPTPRVTVTGIVEVSSPHPTFRIQAMTVKSPAIGGAELRPLKPEYIGQTFKIPRSSPIPFEMPGIPGGGTLRCDVVVKLWDGPKREWRLDIPLT